MNNKKGFSFLLLLLSSGVTYISCISKYVLLFPTDFVIFTDVDYCIEQVLLFLVKFLNLLYLGSDYLGIRQMSDSPNFLV